MQFGTEMFNSVIDSFQNLQTQVNSSVDKIKMSLVPTATYQQWLLDESVAEFYRTPTGKAVLDRVKESHEEIHKNGEEQARLANFCSTRMGRAQQMCMERAQAVLDIDAFMRDSADMDKKIREISAQIAKLQRFCDQTEKAMTHLEGLNLIVKSEEEVKEIRQRSSLVTTSIHMEPIHGAVLNNVQSGRSPTREEVMLNEL